MPARANTGTRIRSLPDWYTQDLMGADQTVTACPGHYQVFGLYNNANDGSVLKVYAVEVFNTATAHIHFSLIPGKAGPSVVTTYGPIDSLPSPGWGIPITVGSAVQIGTNIGGLVVVASVPRNYAPGWPIAIVRPNFSFLLQPDSAGTELDASLWWLSCFA